MSIITTTEALSAFCASLRGAAYVTVDTEFMRERTFYSKLCLVQLGGPDRAVAVDPLAEDIDLQPLFDLMANPAILKVFHAARQDIEIFVNLTDRVPTPMFDTQVAGMVCGFGESVGYEALVSALTDAKVDKSSRFTDWARRPLTERQVEYALGDVTHLRTVYEKLSKKLMETGRGAWVAEEMAVLTDVKTYQIDPYDIWKRLKLRSSKPKSRAILREIAAWREVEAIRLNLPRAHVVKDEALIEIASHAPATIQELGHIRSLSKGFVEGHGGAALLQAIARGAALPPSDCPPAEAKHHLPNGAGAVLDLLKVLLKQVSDEHGVAAKLIASSDDLERLACEDEPDIRLLHGWRGELFGETALALKSGQLALSVHQNKIVTTKK